MRAVIVPGSVVCFDCGGLLHSEVNAVPGNIGMLVTCTNELCDHHGIPHFFPLPGVILAPAPQLSQIIMPGVS